MRTTRTRPGLLRPLPIVAVLLVLAAAAPAAAAGRTVAVLPLVVHALEDRDYLRSGLADMLASRLGRWGEVGVIRVDDPSSATTEAEAARAVGRQVGADWVLFGSFTRFGDGASLDLRCVSTRGEARADARNLFVQAGRIGEIIPKLDGLTEKVVRYVASDGTARPDVAAAGPGGAAGPDLDGLRDELEALRARVEALEAVFPGESGEPVVERDLEAGSRARDGGPGADLARELR